MRLISYIVKFEHTVPSRHFSSSIIIWYLQSISHDDFNFFIAEEIMKSQLNNGIVVTGVLVGNLNLDLKSNAKVVSDTSSYI